MLLPTACIGKTSTDRLPAFAIAKSIRFSIDAGIDTDRQMRTMLFDCGHRQDGDRVSR